MEEVATSTNSLVKKRSLGPPQTPPCATPKRSRGSPQTPPWAALQMELLELIVSKLPFFNIPSFKSVCSSWRKAARTYLNSPLYRSQTPVLMIPSSLHKEHSDEESSTMNKSGVCFYSLKDETAYEFKNAPKEFHKSRCVGSSHGCLVLLDKHADPYLLNLFTRSCIKLPPKERFPHIKSVSRKTSKGNYVSIKYSHDYAFSLISSTSMPFDDFRKSALIQKAILSDNNTVMVMYGHQSNLGYCCRSDSEWTHLQGLYRPYADILCFDNKLFALGSKHSIEVWDFNGSVPVKETDIHPKSEPAANHLSRDRDLYSTHCYLVESLGDILLVTRYVGEFVKDGVPIFEADLLSDDDNHPLVCPYQTLDFKVKKLDFKHKEWLEVRSLGDRALFLGGNHAVSLSAKEHRECKENSIYFTDNYWDRMDEDYLYGGHDMGVFSLEDGSVTRFFEIDDMKITPPPFWVVPCTPST
ncbi:hypothetical protein LguiB_025893 [Lonicera macranthoides]